MTTKAATAPVLRAPRLRPGDQVRLVAPASPPEPARIERGVELLTEWGLRPTLAPNALARHGYLAGSDAQRLADLNEALRDPRVRGVLCLRGGYGTQRIVDGLDLAAARADPKVVVGFSDITALQLALWRGARLASLHGPGLAWSDQRTGAASADSLRGAMMTDEPIVARPSPVEPTAAIAFGSPKPVTGTIIGGNLSLLAASIGTVDAPDLRGAILLLEDVAEAAYRVDRMLVHLQRSGLLDGVAGVVLGQFTECTDSGEVTVIEVLARHLGSLGVPVLGGLPIGHGEGQITVGLGVPATLDLAAATLTVAAAVH